MVLLYTPKVTNRIKYIASLILENLCGISFSITDDKSEYTKFEGARINYSQTPLASEEVFIYAHGLLNMKGIKQIDINVSKKEGAPVIFSGLSDHCYFGFDLFAASFFFVSRYEEYFPYMGDAHGRFEAYKCLSYRNNFLEVPVVNIYALKLENALRTLFKLKVTSRKNYDFIPTYDIDNAYAYRGKGIARNVVGTLRDLFLLRLKKVKERILVLSGGLVDPFDTYSLQLELQKKHGLKPVYFYLAGDYGPYDKNIYVRSRAFESLVKRTGDYSTTGIHPSYESFTNTKKLKMEVKRFSKIANHPITNSRQHFIRLKLPATYQELTENNIFADFSMGFATHTGFRAGICSPYYFYDIEREQILNLRVYPFAVMDMTLNKYMMLSPDEATKKINTLIKTVKSVNGTFISVWHNDSLSNEGEWKDWKDVYIRLIEKAKV